MSFLRRRRRRKRRGNLKSTFLGRKILEMLSGSKFILKEAGRKHMVCVFFMIFNA